MRGLEGLEGLGGQGPNLYMSPGDGGEEEGNEVKPDEPRLVKIY